MTKGNQIDECAKRIAYIRERLENALVHHRAFYKNDGLARATRGKVRKHTQELRLYRARMEFIIGGSDYSNLLNKPLHY